MRNGIFVGLLLACLAGCGGGGSSACSSAGGHCEAITPGSCLNQTAGDSAKYPCGEAHVCCLPSPCHAAGGVCIADPTTCISGHIGDATTFNSGDGPAASCCLPNDDASTH